MDNEILKKEERESPGSHSEDDKRSPSDKYAASSLRDNGNSRGESVPKNRKSDETAAIKVSNLSENTREMDLEELFNQFGQISRIYIARDDTSNLCKGFAFINFFKRGDAARAIATLNGFGYDHVNLSVEWAKPPGKQ